MEPIWGFVRKTKPLKLLVQISVVLALIPSIWAPMSPLFQLVKTKFDYVFAIKPEASNLQQDKYSFWAGFILYDRIHPTSNTDEFLERYFPYRQSLLKSFEVLGFDSRDLSFSSDFQQFSFIERMAQNNELKVRLEGYLEKRNNGNLELYKSGFALAALIAELQSPSVRASKVQNQVQQFSANWAEAQDVVVYRLPFVEINYDYDSYFIYSQPEMMEKALNTLESIRHFYGRI